MNVTAIFCDVLNVSGGFLESFPSCSPTRGCTQSGRTSVLLRDAGAPPQSPGFSRCPCKQGRLKVGLYPGFPVQPSRVCAIFSARTRIISFSSNK